MKGKTMPSMHRYSFLALALLASTAPGAYPASTAGASQAELAQLQAQVKALLEQARAIKEGEDRLATQVDRLFKSTGVRFGGEAVMHSVNFLRLHPIDGSSRVWPTVGYFDFRITAQPRSDLSAEVVYRMEKVFGGFWGSLDISGVRWFNIHGDTPIGFDVGMFHYKNSPLTFWAQDDPMPFEPEVLARKRREGLETVQVKENAFPLQGVRLDAGLLLFGAMDLDLEALGIRTAIAGNKNTGLGFAVTAPFDQYIIGGTARLSPAGGKAVSLGGAYFELIEGHDTNQGVALVPQQRGNVMAGDLTFQLLGEEIVLKAEGALSNYNPAYGTAQVVSWTTGGAGNLFLDVKGKSTSLKLHALYVDEQYINYAAQTRKQDTLREPNGHFATGNNLYNPREGTYTLPTVNNLYFNRYNPIIFATNQGPNGALVLNKFGTQPAGLYLTHSVLNRSLPLGFATPNRSGFGGQIKGSYMEGFLQPTFMGGMYNEPFTAYDVPINTGPRKYMTGGGGMKFDLTPLLGLPMTLQAGAVIEDTRSDSFVAFTSTRLAYDMDWQVFKNVHLLLGFQHTDYNGADFFNMGAGSTWFYVDHLADEYLGGIDWRISKSTQLYITYSFLDFINARDATTSFQNQEYEAKLVVRF
jgi:hypothetical protein